MFREHSYFIDSVATREKTTNTANSCWEPDDNALLNQYIYYILH